VLYPQNGDRIETIDFVTPQSGKKKQDKKETGENEV